jgi:hypothetical protein
MEGKTKVLPNNDRGLDQGVAGVIVESTAGNIFELLVADGFLDFFAHSSGSQFVGLGSGYRTGISPRWVRRRGHIAVCAEEASRHVFEFVIR